MIAWRLEHKKERVGPYNSGILGNDIWMFERQHHYLPYDEFGHEWSNNKNKNRYKFGFASKEDLNDWFFYDMNLVLPVITKLHKYHYVIRTYDISKCEILHGTNQIAFVLSQATIINTYDLNLYLIEHKLIQEGI